MIRKEDIYNSTNSGLSILQYYYPHINEEYASNRHKFKLRNEDDASCVLRERTTSSGVKVFCITDFGADGREKTPIDVAMEFEGKNFYETCCLLAERYNISEYKTEFIKPAREERAAHDDEPDGLFTYKEHPVRENELSIMGPGVTADVFKNYGWMALDSYTVIKDRKAITKFSSSSFPIFARKCRDMGNNDNNTFYKIYQPLNDKQFRFIYYPIGKRQKGYINGLFELQQAFNELNADEEEEEGYDEEGNITHKGKGVKKLNNCFICSGERDSLTAAARGCNVVWFNSETTDISSEDISAIKKYCKQIYNIPDIDETGVRQGIKLALKNLDIVTVWLPESLRTYKDWRGKPRKDFRDWAELHPTNYEFNMLIQRAMPAVFWTLRVSKTGNITAELNSEIFQYFMKLNDFFLYKEDGRDDVYTLMHRTGHVINKITTRDMREWLKLWARERALSLDVRNLISGTKITDAEFKQLDLKTINVIRYDRDWQLYYFKNAVYKVSSDSIDDVTKSGNYCCFADNVINHDIHKLPSMFDIRKIEDGKWHIDIINRDSLFFCYLINSSRIYWQKELEGEVLTWEEELRDKYYAEHKFDICSDLLSAVENQEQMQNLVSKIFAIGYYLHRYKDPAKAWAGLSMDWKLGENGINNGRSGKSFFYSFSKYMQQRLCLSGRNKKLLENNHVFENISRYTDVVLIDDCDLSLKTESFYTMITGDITVNPKNSKSYELTYENSPKFAFTTNYVPQSFSGSDVGRLIYLVFSDYYHEKTEDYKEKRQISDDFGKTLFSSYNDAEWNADYNFWLQCLQFYLSVKEEGKINSVLDNILKRSLKAKLDASFEDWAEGYFSLDGRNCDRLINKTECMLNCRMETGKNLTSHMFKKKLEAWVQLSPHHETLNPEELWSKNSKRIVRTVQGLTTEFFYIKTYGTDISI